MDRKSLAVVVLIDGRQMLKVGSDEFVLPAFVESKAPMALRLASALTRRGHEGVTVRLCPAAEVVALDGRDAFSALDSALTLLGPVPA